MIGFSKRALAAWLAATDPRVMGLVSIGYNNLNVEKQAPNQLREWGQYSPLLRAYTRGGLIEKVYSPPGQKLMATWDPYSFLNRINKPKYILDATNNGYWTLDAFDLYADKLKGPSNLLYVANAGHYMENAIPSVFASAAAWCRATLEKKALPKIAIDAAKTIQNHTQETWTNPPRVRTGLPREARNVKVFFAYSASQDFRETQWQEVPAPDILVSLSVLHEAKLPPVPSDKPFAAAFVEAEFPGGALPLKLTSRVLMWDTRTVFGKAFPQ